jgi:hypothetical protein
VAEATTLERADDGTGRGCACRTAQLYSTTVEPQAIVPRCRTAWTARCRWRAAARRRCPSAPRASARGRRPHGRSHPQEHLCKNTPLHLAGAGRHGVGRTGRFTLQDGEPFGRTAIAAIRSLPGATPPPQPTAPAGLGDSGCDGARVVVAAPVPPGRPGLSTSRSSQPLDAKVGMAPPRGRLPPPAPPPALPCTGDPPAVPTPPAAPAPYPYRFPYEDLRCCGRSAPAYAYGLPPAGAEPNQGLPPLAPLAPLGPLPAAAGRVEGEVDVLPSAPGSPNLQ